MHNQNNCRIFVLTKKQTITTKNKITMTFYGTSLNGKTPVMTTELLKGRGVKMINNQPNGILTYKGEIYNDLYDYWLTEKAFNKLKETTILDRA